MPEKHIPYYKVQDAFSQKECPVCFLVRDSIEKYYQGVFNGKAIDPDFNDKLRLNKGFCNLHSHKLQEYNDGVGVAIMYKLLFSDAIKDIKSIKSNNKKKIEKCLICEYLYENEKRYLSIVSEHISDSEFKENFLKSDGLCVFHYKEFLRKNKKIPNWFSGYHNNRFIEKLSMLEKFLAAHEFTNKNKYALKYDADIWKNVVSQLAAFKGRI